MIYYVLNITVNKQTGVTEMPLPTDCNENGTNHRYSMFGRPSETCVVCGRPNPEIIAWVKLTSFVVGINAIRENKMALPVHPYLADGRLSPKEYAAMMHGKNKR